MAYTNNFPDLRPYLNDINVKYEENSAPITTDSKVKVEEGYCKEEYTEKQDNQSKTLVMSILQYQTGFPAYSMPLQPVLQENMLVKGEYDTNLDIKQEDEGLASKATSAGNSSETSLLLPKSKKIRKQKQPIKSSPKEKEEKKATTKSKSKAPRKKKAFWSHEEDSRALELLAQMGPKWTKIGRIIGGRSGKQVRDRYMQNLKPNINFEKWTKEEDALIMALYSELGSKWLLIAEHLPNRTDNQVKNRFNGKLVHYMPEKPVEKIEEDVKTETDVKVEQS